MVVPGSILGVAGVGVSVDVDVDVEEGDDYAADEDTEKSAVNDAGERIGGDAEGAAAGDRGGPGVATEVMVRRRVGTERRGRCMRSDTVVQKPDRMSMRPVWKSEVVGGKKKIPLWRLTERWRSVARD